MAKRVVLDALNKHRVELIEQSVLSSPISASNPQEAQPVEYIPDQEPVPVSPQVEEGQASTANPESVPVESTSTQEEKAPDINDIPEADETDSHGQGIRLSLSHSVPYPYWIRRPAGSQSRFS